MHVAYSVTVSAVVMALESVDPEGTELGIAVVYVENNNIGYWQVFKYLVFIVTFEFVCFIVPTR